MTRGSHVVSGCLCLYVALAPYQNLQCMGYNNSSKLSGSSALSTHGGGCVVNDDSQNLEVSYGACNLPIHPVLILRRRWHQQYLRRCIHFI